MSKNITLSLGVENLSFLDPQAFEKDFSFIVSGSIYKCNRFFADLISPKVAQMHRNDPTASQFIIKAPDKGSYFMKFLKLSYGETVTITPNAMQYILKIASELGNTTILKSIYDQDQRDITVDTVMQLISEKTSYGLNFRKEYKFAVHHFSEIPLKSVLQVDLDTISNILCDEDLCIDNEDWLFELIRQIIKEKGQDYRILFGCLYFEYMTPTAMASFVSMVKYEDVSAQLWSNLKRRLVLSVQSPGTSFRYTKKDKSFEIDPSDPFNGICNFLNDKYNGNAHEKGAIEITSSSIGINQPNQVIDYGWEGDWGTQNKPNSWLMFDFKDYLVELIGYSLMSIPSSINNTHPRSWAVEASNDLENWDILDKREMNNDLNGKNKVKCFAFRRSDTYRYVRIRQTDLNHSHNNYFAISQMELFGSISSAVKYIDDKNAKPSQPEQNNSPPKKTSPSRKGQNSPPNQKKE